MTGPNVRSMALDWWRHLWFHLGLRRAVRVRHPAPGQTQVEVDDRIPHLARRGRPARYRITTKGQMLRTDHFADPGLRSAVRRDAAKARNRALFCTDLRTGEVMAAASFHIDDDRQLPLHIREIGLRDGADDDAGVRAHSELCAHILLAYLLVVGGKDGRGEVLGFLSENDEQRELAADFGFQPAERPATVTQPGDYMTMRPPPRLPKR